MQNRQFAILEVIAILLVVLGHLGGIPRMNEVFSIYGYHMPLFIFISGYFYKQTATWKDFFILLRKKTKTLLLPFLGWNVVYACVVWILHRRGTTAYFADMTGIFSIHNLLIEPFIGGHQYLLNLPMWFVGALFFVQIAYSLLRLLTHGKGRNSVWLVLLLMAGLATIVCCNRFQLSRNLLPLTRTIFLLPFFHFGHWYKQSLEQKDKGNSLAYFAVLVFVQAGLYLCFGTVEYYAVWCNFKGFGWQVYVSSFVGILFWLRVSRLLQKIPYDSRLINYTARHTWSIMTHHLFVIFCINWLAVHIPLRSADMNLFRTNFWYRVPQIGRWIYATAGMLLPLIWQYLFDGVKAKTFAYLRKSP